MSSPDGRHPYLGITSNDNSISLDEVDCGTCCEIPPRTATKEETGPALLGWFDGLN
jgi:hypothetical protein